MIRTPSQHILPHLRPSRLRWSSRNLPRPRSSAEFYIYTAEGRTLPTRNLSHRPRPAQAQCAQAGRRAGPAQSLVSGAGAGAVHTRLLTKRTTAQVQSARTCQREASAQGLPPRTGALHAHASHPHKSSNSESSGLRLKARAGEGVTGRGPAGEGLGG
jgi:hypothetical protein